MLPVSVVGSICCSGNIWIMRMYCGAIVIPPITMWRNTSTYVIRNSIGNAFRTIVICIVCRNTFGYNQLSKLEKSRPNCAEYCKENKPMFRQQTVAKKCHYKAAPDKKESMQRYSSTFCVFFKLFFFAHLSVQKLVKLFVPTLSLTNFGHLNQDINNISSLKLIIGQAVYGENYAAFRV